MFQALLQMLGLNKASFLLSLGLYPTGAEDSGPPGT